MRTIACACAAALLAAVCLWAQDDGAARAYIGQIEYDPETNRARVGFLRMPTRALVSELAPESARISMVAGARYVVLKKIPGRAIEFAYLLTELWVTRIKAGSLAA